MKRSKVTEDQNIGILREPEARVPFNDLRRKHEASDADVDKSKVDFQIARAKIVFDVKVNKDTDVVQVETDLVTFYGQTAPKGCFPESLVGSSSIIAPVASIAYRGELYKDDRSTVDKGCTFFRNLPDWSKNDY